MSKRIVLKRMVPAIPLNQDDIVLEIPAGEELELLESQRRDAPYVRARWNTRDQGMISLRIAREDLA